MKLIENVYMNVVQRKCVQLVYTCIGLPERVSLITRAATPATSYSHHGSEGNIIISGPVKFCIGLQCSFRLDGSLQPSSASLLLCFNLHFHRCNVFSL